MPALDHCQPEATHALEKDGWDVGEKPFPLFVTPHPLLIDLQATRENRTIFVEVKCFPDSSNSISDLYGAIGQYMVYRAVLQQMGLKAALYLAVPNTAFHDVFRRVGMGAVKDGKIKLIIFDRDKEVIEQWLE
jgi:hypothetical protein